MSIQIRDIRFGYYEDGRDTIDGISMDFDRSEITVLTGRSGCGKSTLLYLIAGIYPSNAGFLRSGSISVEGSDPAKLSADKRCRSVGLMFQNPDLQFCMDTVFNELVFTAENLAIDPEIIPDMIRESLEFSEIEHLRDRRLTTLSGGEKQKVMLACLHIMNPAWMLLDEALANVDDASAEMILGKIIRLHRERGTGILAVDHRLGHWLGRADNIVLMEDGRVLTQYDPGSDADLGELLAKGVQTGSEPYRIAAKDAAGADPDKAGIDSASQIPILTLEHVSVSHDGYEVLRDISAEFCQGRIYAIVGQSGCGKSSLFGALSGLYRYSGSVRIGDTEISRMKRRDFGRLGFVTQNPQDQFIGGTVRQEIEAAFRKDRDRETRSEEILRRIGLWKYRDVSPYLLSQGQQRRLGVASLMAYPCEVLICDEPTYAQDRNNTITIMDMLTDGARERGAAMLFSTHDMQLARDYADKIYMLEGGTLHEW